MTRKALIQCHPAQLSSQSATQFSLHPTRTRKRNRNQNFLFLKKKTDFPSVRVWVNWEIWGNNLYQRPSLLLTLTASSVGRSKNHPNIPSFVRRTHRSQQKLLSQNQPREEVHRSVWWDTKGTFHCPLTKVLEWVHFLLPICDIVCRLLPTRKRIQAPEFRVLAALH